MDRPINQITKIVELNENRELKVSKYSLKMNISR